MVRQAKQVREDMLRLVCKCHGVLWQSEARKGDELRQLRRRRGGDDLFADRRHWRQLDNLTFPDLVAHQQKAGPL